MDTRTTFQKELEALRELYSKGAEADPKKFHNLANSMVCLLYTSDAADDLLCVDLGGRRLIKKKKTTKQAKTRVHRTETASNSYIPAFTRIRTCAN